MVEVSDSNERKMEIENSEIDSDSCVKEEQILQALTTLRQLNKNFAKSAEKKPLFEDFSESSIFLQVTLKKIPPRKCQKFINIRLPNSCVTNKTEVCLITGDLNKKDRKAEIDSDIIHFKELLRKEDISAIDEVITLRQLRTEYKPYEAKRKLMGAYDVFLCDKKIAGVLPSTLGKSFFKKRKLPLQINMNNPNLKRQIDIALSTTRFHLTCRGNSVVSEIANLTMEDTDILENVCAATDTLKRDLPGHWNNILGIYIKTAKSKAIPVYLSFDSTSEVNLKSGHPKQRSVVGELSTVPDALVSVSKDGRIFVKKIEEDGGSEANNNGTGKRIVFKRTKSEGYENKGEKISQKSKKLKRKKIASE